MQNELRATDRSITDLEAQIASLTAKLSTANEAKTTLQGRITKGEQVIATLVQDEEEANAALAACEDVTPRINELREAVTTATRLDETRSRRKIGSETLEKLRAEASEAERSHIDLDGKLTALRHLRAHLLDDLELGITGLSVGDGELRLDDVPYRQASKAQRLRVACRIATLQRPQLKLLRIDEGEQLDSESKAIVFEIANQAGFQVVMTAVTDTKGLTFEIVEAEYAE